MTGKWGSTLHKLLLLVLLSVVLASDQPSDDPRFRSKWNEVKQDIDDVLEGLPPSEDTKPDVDDDIPLTHAQTDRGQALRDLYSRLVSASVQKRGLYGNVLNGYKLGKREFMPYGLMNEYQKRLFGSVLNQYKFGKRVPEELPANYVTGGQIYDKVNDDRKEDKRGVKSLLEEIGAEKRIPPLYYYGKGVRNPLFLYPNYRLLRQSLFGKS